LALAPGAAVELAESPAHLSQLERWLKSYRPEELFDEHGALRTGLSLLAPRGTRRLGATPHANGGLLLRDLHLPDIRDHAVPVEKPGVLVAESTRVLGAICATC
jgi:xylulose-5-phosphate/fructose-6-phosphate phosphoketolase